MRKLTRRDSLYLEVINLINGSRKWKKTKFLNNPESVPPVVESTPFTTLPVGDNLPRPEVLSTLLAEPTSASFPVSLTTADTSLVEEEQPETESKKRSRRYRSNPNPHYARVAAFIRQERSYLDDIQLTKESVETWENRESCESFSKPNK